MLQVTTDYNYSVKKTGATYDGWKPSDSSDSGLIWDWDNNHGEYTSTESEGGNVLVIGGSARVIKPGKWVDNETINARIDA